MLSFEQLSGYCYAGAWTRNTDLARLLKHRGNIHEHLRIHHVAGTNGKGSVCAMLSQVLRKQFDENVGLFVSPHLVHVNERIQINGVMIDDIDLLRLATYVHQEAHRLDVYLSFFALMMLVSIHYFLEHKVDCVVYEVGLGGTYDTTNIRTKPLATYITSIGFDHMHILGSTKAQIQRNKMGIMKPGVPCFTAVDNPLMHHAAKIKKAQLHIVDTPAKISLPGTHQQTNAGLVMHGLCTLGYDSKKIASGLMHVTHLGRLQFLYPWLLLDCAHNEQGIRALSDYLDTIKHTYTTIITIFGTTKKTSVLQELLPLLICGDENWLVGGFAKKAVDPEIYQQDVVFSTRSSHDIHTLIQDLEQTDTNDQLLVLVYGSLYLIGEILRGNQS